MTKIVEPFIENMAIIREEQRKQKEPLSEKQINEYIYDQSCEYMDLLGEFCKNCAGLARDELKSPFEPIFEVIWGYIQEILSNFSSLEKLCESTTRVLKHSLRIVPGTFKQTYLVTFLKIVISQFALSPLSCFIYSVEFCMKEYSGDEKL